MPYFHSTNEGDERQLRVKSAGSGEGPFPGANLSREFPKGSWRLIDPEQASFRLASIPAAWFSQKSRIKATVLRLIFAQFTMGSFATTATMAVAAAYF